MTPRRRIVPVFVPHLGCTHQCVFCDQRTISGRPEPAGPETVREVLRSAQAVTACAELAFYGGSFTAIPWPEQRALLEAAAPFRETGFLTSIRLSTRPDCIRAEELDRLREYGVETVELGAQSMDDRVLLRSGRGHGAEDTVCAARLLRGRSFRVVLQMMTGLPGSDPETDLRTAQRLAELHPQGVRIYPTLVLRDTPLAALWSSGVYKARSVEEAVETCAPILTLFRDAGIPVLRLGCIPPGSWRPGFWPDLIIPRWESWSMGGCTGTRRKSCWLRRRPCRDRSCCRSIPAACPSSPGRAGRICFG